MSGYVYNKSAWQAAKAAKEAAAEAEANAWERVFTRSLTPPGVECEEYLAERRAEEERLGEAESAYQDGYGHGHFNDE